MREMLDAGDGRGLVEEFNLLGALAACVRMRMYVG
jgi:hypothetical protein